MTLDQWIVVGQLFCVGLLPICLYAWFRIFRDYFSD